MDKNIYLFDRLKKQKVLLAAHRGTCGGNIIQNTIGAYENALLHGADIIEVDVVKSTDGKFLLFTMDRKKESLEKNWIFVRCLRKKSKNFISLMGFRNEFQKESIRWMIFWSILREDA